MGKAIAIVIVLVIVVLLFQGNFSAADFIFTVLFLAIPVCLLLSGIGAILEITSKDDETGPGELAVRIILGIISIFFLLNFIPTLL